MNKKIALFSIFWCINLFFILIYKENYFSFNIHTPFIWILDFIFIIYLIWSQPKEQLKYFFVIFFIFMFLKILGSLSILNEYKDNKQFLIDIIRTPINYMFPFFLYLSFKDIQKKEIIKIFNTYKYLSLLIQITILIGFIFSIHFFETYRGNRFGYSGILYPSSFSSYFIILNLMILYFYNEKISDIKYFLYFSFIVALLIGTKTVYMFLGVFILYIFVTKKLFKNRYFFILLTVIGVSLFVFQSKLKIYFYNTFSNLIDLYNNQDVITFIFSYRNIHLREIFDYIQNHWSFYNYLIGGINRKQTLAEMSLIDIFFNFGILGLIFYLGLIFLFIKNKNFSFKFFFLLLFFLTALAGNFFNTTVIAYSLVFMLLIANYKNADLHNISKKSDHLIKKDAN